MEQGTPDVSEVIPFARPDLGTDEVNAVLEVLHSGWITSGRSMRAFEEEFTAFVGGNVDSVAVNSGTAGLHLALEALGVGPGDEVIVPDWTFTATAEVVRYLGATPVIVDVDPDSLNISIERVLDAVSPKTAAVIPVHFAGLPVDVVTLRRELRDGIAIVEDAAHALPAMGAAGLVGAGSHSDAAVFSFYATKPVTTGEGGMLTTRVPHIAARSRTMRLHGIDRDAFDRYSSPSSNWAYDVVAPGYKYNMPDIAAAMGRVQLSRAYEMRDRRQRIAEHYSDEFRELAVTIPRHSEVAGGHAWHLYVLRMEPESRCDRDTFIAAMESRGIGTSVHFIPLHLLSYWRPFVGGDPQRRLPVAHSYGTCAVSLPIYSGMTDEQVGRVAEAVKDLLT